MHHEEEEDEEETPAASAKIEQLIHLLKLTPTTEKSLVFSQFTSFLDKVCVSFEIRFISELR
jgi:SWI/SNF-related matrix-associated actin-dependent regulator of chromatin subfamily A3